MDEANPAVSLEATPWLDPGAEPFVRIEGLTKRFGSFTAVDAVDLSIYRGELFAILGASGCGKSTLLRMLAGLETPSEGRIVIDDLDVTHLPPYERPVNMMFQSYAIFPHMTVEQNVAYGLRKEGLPRALIKRRVEEMLELVKLSDLARRKPRQISGGQSQRVALARALIKQPKVLLLDEPLAALDKKLREYTQFELANVQEELGVTFVVVTHDQEEAMTLSTRIAVMDTGRFVQIGTPGEIYEEPRSRLVADFVGKINLFQGVVAGCGAGVVQVRCAELDRTLEVQHAEAIPEGTCVSLALRPEKIFIHREPPEGDSVGGTVFDMAYYGNLSLYRVRTAMGHIVEVSAQNRRRDARRYAEWDDEVFLTWDAGSVQVFAE